MNNYLFKLADQYYQLSKSAGINISSDTVKHIKTILSKDNTFTIRKDELINKLNQMLKPCKGIFIAPKDLNKIEWQDHMQDFFYLNLKMPGFQEFSTPIDTHKLRVNVIEDLGSKFTVNIVLVEKISPEMFAYLSGEN